MKKIFDKYNKQSMSVPAAEVQETEAAWLFLCLNDGTNPSKTAAYTMRWRAIMLGLNIRQAAAVLALARWLPWAAREQEK